MINYAPIIDKRIPAFFTDNNNGGVSCLKIYFKHNMAVSKSEVAGMKIILKPYSQNSQTEMIAGYITKSTNSSGSHYNLDEGKIVLYTVSMKNNYKFQPGMFYKIQIAYLGKDGNLGPYSSIGIAKCLGDAGGVNLFVKNLKYKDSEDKLIVNSAQEKYVGEFWGNNLINENVYQYRFYFQTKDKKTVLKDTGWIEPIYKNGNPVMSCEVKDELTPGVEYTLGFEIKTINGYSKKIEYRISGTKYEYPNRYGENLRAYQDEDAIENAYTIIELYSPSGKRYSQTESGNYRLLRRELSTNVWELLTTFSLTQRSNLTKFLWKDYAIEAGKKYLYAIQQYYTDANTEETFYSEKKMADNIIIPEFEHMFLVDKERSLKICFNPNVSSIKNVIQETKTELLGNKYPIFSRNGHINYKELPISGLISYHMDLQHLFSTSEEKGLVEFNTTRGKTPNPKPASFKYVNIKGLQRNVINEDQGTYMGEFLESEKRGKVIQYTYKLTTASDTKTILDSCIGVPTRDKNNTPIFNFVPKYQLEHGTKYKITLEVYTSKDNKYSAVYTIAKHITQKNMDLSTNNFEIEKEFKLKVLDWLNNGQPKIFKSPAEGTYIVRLMNVSLSPNATVGRMLHTFSATAYQIADTTLENMKDLSLVNYKKYGSSQNWSDNYPIKLEQTYYINEKSKSGAPMFVVIPVQNSTSSVTCYDERSNKSSFKMFLKNRPEYVATGGQAVTLALHIYTNNGYASLGPLSNLVRISMGQEYLRNLAGNANINFDNAAISILLKKMQKPPKGKVNPDEEAITCTKEEWDNFKDACKLDNNDKIEDFCSSYGFNVPTNTSGTMKFPADSNKWYQHWNATFKFTKGNCLIFPTRSLLNGMHGKVVIKNNKINSERATAVNHYKNICRYSKVKNITIKASNDLQDPWGYYFCNYTTRSDKTTIQVIKTLQKLFEILEVKPDSGVENPKVTIVFKDGSKRVYAKKPTGSEFSISKITALRGSTQIAKIMPSLGTTVKCSGLVSYATSPRLGHFALGNSRLGDEYV